MLEGYSIIVLFLKKMLGSEAESSDLIACYLKSFYVNKNGNNNGNKRLKIIVYVTF